MSSIMKKNKLKINEIISIMLLSISTAILSLYLMIGKITILSEFITLIISFIVSTVFLVENYNNLTKTIIKNKKISIIGFILSIIIFYELTLATNNNNFPNRYFNIINYYYLALPSIIFIITIVFNKIIKWFQDFLKNMDNFEKKAYIFTSILMFILLAIIYINHDYFYLQFDEVYSIDSGRVYETFIPDPHYYDIRHPITSLLTFPVYAIVDFIFNENLKPIILQFINIQFLIFTGLELKRLTKNKWIYIFFIISFPTLLFSLFFEKFNLSVFLIVTYLYNIFINKKSSNQILILSIGTLGTNIFIASTEFLRKIKLEEKLKNVSRIAITGLIIIILTGRISCLTNGFNELKTSKSAFAFKHFTIIEKLNATSKMIEHSFFAIPSSQTVHKNINTNQDNNVYLWNDVINTPSYIGIAIIIIILIGITKFYKEKCRIYFSFLTAFIFSILLFLVFNWSTYESPLFSICFSWAIIPLFILGIDKIFKEINLNKIYIYGLLVIAMLLINITELVNIYQFVLQKI